jgi:hypothetical protein
LDHVVDANCGACTREERLGSTSYKNLKQSGVSPT